MNKEEYKANKIVANLIIICLILFALGLAPQAAPILYFVVWNLALVIEEAKLRPFKLRLFMLVYYFNHVDLKSFKSRNFSKDIQPILT